MTQHQWIAKKAVSYTVAYGKTFCCEEEKPEWKRKRD